MIRSRREDGRFVRVWRILWLGCGDRIDGERMSRLLAGGFGGLEGGGEKDDPVLGKLDVEGWRFWRLHGRFRWMLL